MSSCSQALWLRVLENATHGCHGTAFVELLDASLTLKLKDGRADAPLDNSGPRLHLQASQKRGAGRQTDKQVNLTVWVTRFISHLLDCVEGREETLRRIQRGLLAQPHSRQQWSWECLELFSTFPERLLTAPGSPVPLATGITWACPGSSGCSGEG